MWGVKVSTTTTPSQLNGHAVGVLQQVVSQAELHHPALNVYQSPDQLHCLAQAGGQGDHHNPTTELLMSFLSSSVLNVPHSPGKLHDHAGCVLQQVGGQCNSHP